jgi:zinc/manganese transport system substrate-binding protein
MRTILILLTLFVTLAAGCGAPRGRGLQVVATTNVYGDIASQIGGSHVHVTSILDNPNADPHLFEPGTAVGLAVARASVVIENGAGYDAFVDKLQSAAPSSSRVSVTIAKVLGVHGAGANPHVWYDVPRLPRIAAAIEEALARADPAHRRAYAAGLARFDRSLAPLRKLVAEIRAKHAGAPVAYTEPVPGYLVAAAGLRNLAPDAFTRAIEDGTDPTASSVSTMLQLVRRHRVRVLLYNDQAFSRITQQVRSAALAARIPVIGVSETLPARLTFQRWQTDQARALLDALGRATP